MPIPTPDEIEDAAAQAAADGVQSVTTDGQTTVVMDPEKLLRVRDKLAARSITSTGSGWGMARTARAIPPGAGPE